VTLGCLFPLQSLYTAHHLVLADQAAYDEAWAATMEHAEERTALDVLDRLEKRLTSSLGIPARQLNISPQSVADSAPIQGFARAESLRSSSSSSSGRQAHTSTTGSAWDKASTTLRSFARSMSLIVDQAHDDRPAWKDLFAHHTEGAVNLRCPVTCLDQLYCQATALLPVLIKKVQSWAAASGGYFMTAEGGSRGFVRWRDVCEEELHTGGRVRWASIKSAGRAIEKANRSYDKVGWSLLSHLDMCWPVFMRTCCHT
jgi:hypothetical protein